MPRQRVLLLCSDHLFGESMERILSAAPDVHLIGPVGLEDDVHAHIAAAKPHVVVIADEELGSEKAARLTASLVEQHPELSVIRVGLNDTILRVFSTHTLPARVNELLGAIQNPAAAGSLTAAHVSSRESY